MMSAREHGDQDKTHLDEAVSRVCRRDTHQQLVLRHFALTRLLAYHPQTM